MARSSFVDMSLLLNGLSGLEDRRSPAPQHIPKPRVVDPGFRHIRARSTGFERNDRRLSEGRFYPGGWERRERR